MPELDIIYVQECIEWQTKVIHQLDSKKTHFYKISYDPTIFPQGRPTYDGRVNPYFCTCPNYKYKGMYKSQEQCKHIKKLKGTFCNWHGFIDTAQTRLQKLNHICPVCGGKTRTIAMGV